LRSQRIAQEGSIAAAAPRKNLFKGSAMANLAKANEA
jgi:hypothetical protein